MSTLRRLLPYLLIVISIAIAIFFLRTNEGSLAQVWQTLQTARPDRLLLALLLWGVWQASQVRQFQFAYQLVGIPAKFKTLIAVTIANNFVNTFVPTGNLSTFALFGYHAHQQAWQVKRSWLGLVVFALAEYGMASVIVFFALQRYRAAVAVHWLEFWPALALIVGALAATAVCYWIVKNAATLAAWLSQFEVGFDIPQLDVLADTINGWLRPTETGASVFAALQQFQPLLWGRLYLSSLVGKLANIALLMLVGQALHVDLSVLQGLIGSGFAFVYTVLSPVPQGIGIVESTLAYQLTQLGVAQSASVAIGVLYRGFTLWLGAMLGLVMLYAVGLQSYASQLQQKEVGVSD